MYRRNRWPEAISVFAVGIAVGAALGVLFAPGSGDETRDFLAESARDGLDGVVAKGRKLGRQAQRAVDDLKGQVADAADASERAYGQAARRGA
jgi:gas vesicle protein